MNKKRLVCEQCGNEFKWYRRRRICNDCRVINKAEYDIKFQRDGRRIRKKPRDGERQYTSTNIIMGQDGPHIKGWLELNRSKSSIN